MWDMTYFRIAVVALLATALTTACDKREKDTNQGLPPADQWQAPPQALPPGGAATTTPADPHARSLPGMAPSNPHAGGMTPGNPAAAPANPHAGGMGEQGGTGVEALGLQPPDPNRNINPDHYLRGSIKPNEETKVGIPMGAVIFISVKRADPSTGQAMGSPLAVKRLRLSEWPVWFNLTDEDAMIMGTALSGDVVITAWADQDQDAISKTAGDVLGTLRATVPGKDLTVVLDTVIQ
jgi:hypothetical protein